MLENDEHKEKKNFTESENAVLLAEVEVRAGTLFGSLSSSSTLFVIVYTTKFLLWQTPRCIKNKNSINSLQNIYKNMW